ncbi:MAG: type I phosphomannose isomerase catalytic subunit [Phycisphaerae bacterium]
MTHPMPVMLEPIFVPKPWGGRALERLLNKSLPAGVAIGESWELADLPGAESRVACGPLRGRSIRELASAWGADLFGDAPPAAGRFPLLIKFLDARETLSVQVHPLPQPGVPDEVVGVKHEAWYIVHAEPGAELFVGLRDGVTLDDLRRTADTPQCADLLRRWPARVGDCFYLPSGTVHALGGGIVVAEVQTPSDTTYRLYDWGRADERGRRRELHIADALANARLGDADGVLAPRILSPGRGANPSPEVAQIINCDRFTIALRRLTDQPVGACGAAPRVWIVVGGSGELRSETGARALSAGDTLLIPAATPAANCVGVFDVLEVTPAPRSQNTPREAGAPSTGP